MASLIPIPDLHLDVSGNTCCSNNRSHRVVYNDETGKFEINNVSFLCCVCGGGDLVRDENARTWDAFINTMHQRYGVSPEEVDQHREWKKMRQSGKELRVGHFDDYVDWANGVHTMRTQSTSPETGDEVALTVPSIRINLDVRVRSESGYEEPFSPEHLVEDLRMRKKAVLSDDQIEEIVGRVVEEIQQSGKREISKTEIGNLVSRKLDEAGY